MYLNYYACCKVDPPDPLLLLHTEVSGHDLCHAYESCVLVSVIPRNVTGIVLGTLCTGSSFQVVVAVEFIRSDGLRHESFAVRT